VPFTALRLRLELGSSTSEKDESPEELAVINCLFARLAAAAALVVGPSSSEEIVGLGSSSSEILGVGPSSSVGVEVDSSLGGPNVASLV